jgi:hypothetical protein
MFNLSSLTTEIFQQQKLTLSCLQAIHQELKEIKELLKYEIRHEYESTRTTK